jgi:hypothetical protein
MNYKFCQSSIMCTDSIEDLGVFLDSKFNFHSHVSYSVYFLTELSC